MTQTKTQTPAPTAQVTQAIAGVVDLLCTGRIQAAIDEASIALSGPVLAPEQRAELLEWRACALFNRGEAVSGAADEQALQALAAQNRRNPAVQGWALRRHALVAGRSGNADEALAAARVALKAAQTSGHSVLHALCLQTVASAQGRLGVDRAGCAPWARERWPCVRFNRLQMRWRLRAALKNATSSPRRCWPGHGRAATSWRRAMR